VTINHITTSAVSREDEPPPRRSLSASSSRRGARGRRGTWGLPTTSSAAPVPRAGACVRILASYARGLALLREADEIFTEEVRRGPLPDIWQGFVVLLPVRSVGVMGTEGHTAQRRSPRRLQRRRDDGDGFRMPHDVLGCDIGPDHERNPRINRVVYDISSKPPATIEWE